MLFTRGAAGKSFQGGDLGSLKKGQKLLILGGATLVGMYAIQMVGRCKLKP